MRWRTVCSVLVSIVDHILHHVAASRDSGQNNYNFRPNPLTNTSPYTNTPKPQTPRGGQVYWYPGLF